MWWANDDIENMPFSWGFCKSVLLFCTSVLLSVCILSVKWSAQSTCQFLTIVVLNIIIILKRFKSTYGMCIKRSTIVLPINWTVQRKNISCLSPTTPKSFWKTVKALTKENSRILTIKDDSGDIISHDTAKVTTTNNYLIPVNIPPLSNNDKRDFVLDATHEWLQATDNDKEVQSYVPYYLI